MKKNRFLSILICLAMVIAILPGSAVHADAKVVVPMALVGGDGSYGNPFVVEDLPYTIEGDVGDDLYYAWTAPADGALYLTKLEGDYSLYSISGSSVGEEQTLENGTRVYAAAGDTIYFNVYCSSWSGSAFKLEMTFVEGEEPQPDGSESYPYPAEVPSTVELPSGSVYYTWTAPADGALTVTFTAADYYCSISGASEGKGSAQKVDGGYLQYAAAGDELTIYVVNYDETACQVSLAFAEGAQPGADGSEDFPYPIESFPVSVNGVEAESVYYTWTAAEDGALYIMSQTEDFDASVTGASAGKGSTTEIQGGYRQYVAAGDRVRIKCNCWYSDYTAEITFAAGEQPQPDGSGDFPFPVEVPSTHNQAANSDLYYTWTAAEDGVLTVTSTAVDAWVSFTVNGSWADATGESGVYSLSVTAGNVVVVNVSESAYNDYESAFTVSFAFGNEGGQPDPGPGPDAPELPDGVTGSGTATDPYRFTKAATLTLDKPDEDIYFQAPEGMQVAYTGGYVADAFWTEMDNPFIAGYNQTYVLTPDYGVTVTLTVSDPGADPEPDPDPDPDGSANNPYVIESLPYNIQQTESDVYYTWTAAEDGTLVLTSADSGYISFSGNDNYKEETETGYTLKVSAGDVIILNVYMYGDSYTGVLSFIPDGQGPVKDMGLVVTAPEVALEPGQTFTVDVSVKDNLGFTSFKNSVIFDEEVLELVSLEAGELCGGTFVFNAKKGIVTYIHGVAGTVTEDGVLFTLTFRVNAGAQAGAAEVGVTADYFYGAANDLLDVDGASANVEVQACDVQWATVNATLTGSIDLNYYAILSEDLVNDPTTFVRFTYANEVMDVPMSEAKVSVKDGVTRYSFRCKVYAKHMTDDVTAQVMTDEGPVGEAKTYSVAEYCYTLMDLTTNAQIIDICKAMLNYGAAAQKHFDYRVDDLANAQLSEADRFVARVEDASAYAYSIVGSEEGIKAKSALLTLEADVTIRVIFAPTGDRSVMDYTYTIDGKEVEPIADGDRCYVLLDRIPASRFDEFHAFSTGGLTVNYSVLSYLYMVNMAGNYPEDLVNMVDAMYAYFVASEAYFE